MFSRYCNELVELKILDRYVVGFTGGRYSYYFRPVHRQCVIWAIKVTDEQQTYVIEQEKKETKDDDLDKMLAKYSGTVDYD